MTGFFYGPIFPISLSHTHNPTHNTLLDMNYIQTPRNLVLGILVSSWPGGSMTLGVFLWDGWMDGWMNGFPHSRFVEILRREREPLLKEKVSC